METKNNKQTNLLEFALIISIVINVVQFASINSVKEFELRSARNKFQMMSGNLVSMSDSLNNFIKATEDMESKKSQSGYELFSTWNGVYSVSKELEFKLYTINLRYTKSISEEILKLQSILSIVNMNLYGLNIEFLNRNPSAFILTDEEKEILGAIADIYSLLGNGIIIKHSIDFSPDLFQKLAIPLGKIDSTGWYQLME